MSGVTYIFILFLYKVIELLGGGSVINGPTPSSSSSIKYINIFNRPGVEEAVLQSPLSLIH